MSPDFARAWVRSRMPPLFYQLYITSKQSYHGDTVESRHQIVVPGQFILKKSLPIYQCQPVTVEPWRSWGTDSPLTANGNAYLSLSHTIVSRPLFRCHMLHKSNHEFSYIISHEYRERSVAASTFAYITTCATPHSVEAIPSSRQGSGGLRAWWTLLANDELEGDDSLVILAQLNKIHPHNNSHNYKTAQNTLRNESITEYLSLAISVVK